ncbi:hypothetical protein [Mycobacterium sp. GA-2829]|uniref:hypothetical protein n=1 Tax=Mycobacterium sp. GA-2829 TaxID=1772283 RepID=UPI00073FFB89|nr:hypothetical protein [Mycobacterium sp. GA-2829]KUI40254.1 hypothetical protein AU194_12380 [Mycobacterium sp. GA-2829]
MTHALVLLLALLIGVVAGLRTFTAPAVIAWAGMLDWIALDGTWAQWVAHPIAVAVFTVLAVGELVTDQLPKTPSRKTPMQFVPRLVSGGFAGAVLGTAFGYTFGGLGAGVIGAVIGTLGGYEARKRLVARNGGRDLPIALLEDAVAVIGGVVIVLAASVI